jgi:hypothetical protein
VGGAGGRSGQRTATGAIAAVGAYLANDLRDAEGLARPVLRRVAHALMASRPAALRRVGAAYLRLDPPLVDELERAPGGASVAQVPGSANRNDLGVIEDAEFIEIDGVPGSDEDELADGGSVSASGDADGTR